jgi:hypothetical protein
VCVSGTPDYHAVKHNDDLQAAPAATGCETTYRLLCRGLKGGGLGGGGAAPERGGVGRPFTLL